MLQIGGLEMWNAMFTLGVAAGGCTGADMRLSEWTCIIGESRLKGGSWLALIMRLKQEFGICWNEVASCENRRGGDLHSRVAKEGENNMTSIIGDGQLHSSCQQRRMERMNKGG